MTGIKHYIPGSPEFDAIAKTVLHVTRVRKDCYGKQTYIDAEPATTRMSHKRRSEDLDKLR